MPELDAAYRITCNEEVNQGLTEEQALVEAQRCLDCPEPTCMTGCPVEINIPTFIKHIEKGEFLAHECKTAACHGFRGYYWLHADFVLTAVTFL